MTLIVALMMMISAPSAPARDRVLLQHARVAMAKNDRISARRFLRGWASIASREKLPIGLEASASAAMSFIDETGRLRLFGWWQDGFVQVGLHDPAEIVNRVEAWAIAEVQPPRPLVKEGGLSDRRSRYRLDDAGSAKAVRLRAIFVADDGTEVVLTEVTLDLESASEPPTPDPAALSRRFQPRPSPPLVAVEPEPVVRWWWVAAGIVAIALAGAAIAEEI